MVRKPVVQEETLAASDLTKVFDLRTGLDDGRGNTTPDNVVLVYTTSALSGSEVFNITGMPVGKSTYLDAVLITEVALVASKMVRVDLSDACLALSKIKIVGEGITAAETCQLTLYTW